MKSFLTFVIFVCISMLCLISSGNRLRASDAYIRDRVIKIYSAEGSSCTGIQVYAPSGKIYILTAAHCAEFMPNGDALASDEKGDEYPVILIAIDKAKDLMIMSRISDNAIRIADKWYKHEKIHTITHGKGMPSYRTDGELLEEQKVETPIFPITDIDSAKKCMGLNQVIMKDFFSDICVQILNSVIGTARVVPGSSGGPVLDDSGKLVGIVSNTDGFFAGYVSLEDIKAFLKEF